MTSVVKNRIMRILAVIAIVCVGMVFTFSVNTAKAQKIAENGFAVMTSKDLLTWSDRKIIFDKSYDP